MLEPRIGSPLRTCFLEREHERVDAGAEDIATRALLKSTIRLGVALLRHVAAPALLSTEDGVMLTSNDAMERWLRDGGIDARRRVRVVLDGGSDSALIREEIHVDTATFLVMLLVRPEGESEERLVAASAKEWGATARQAEVLRLLVQGHSNAAIALQLKIRENTVEVHVSSLFRKANVCSRIELVKRVLR
jgi:DNA-binding CsgD family transcriptional regulator